MNCCETSWEQRKLGELGEIVTGSTPSTTHSEYYSDDGIPWVTPTDINENLICDTPRKLSDEGAKVSRVVPANTILCTCIASIGKNALLTVKGSFNQQINSLTPSKENDAYFLLTESELWSNTMKRMAASGTMQIVNKAEFSELQTMVPSLPEQQQIGTYFQQLDTLITLHQRKVDKLQQVKKAYLCEMFPENGKTKPKRRFKGFTDDWEQRKLGCLIDELKSGLSRMLSEEDIGVPVVRANNINNEHLDLTKDIKYWFLDDPKGVDISNYLIHEKDVLINFINSESKMGSCAIVEKEPNRATIYTTNILRMKLNEDKCDNHFFLAKSLTKEYKDYIKGISKIAVNQASFTTVDFKNFDISLPSVGEQRKIGFFFQQLDNLITLHQHKQNNIE